MNQQKKNQLKMSIFFMSLVLVLGGLDMYLVNHDHPIIQKPTGEHKVGITSGFGCLETTSTPQQYETNMQLMRDLTGHTFVRCS